ncbi:tail assembly chaperone [Streptomyces phage Phredrick]|nr:tail assembly chaperone [Streptomyces phage Phredrick]
MATTVYTTEEVELQDGTTVTLKPLTIKNLRKFMKTMEAFAEAETEEDGLEVMLDSAALCLKTQRPEFWNEKTNKHAEDFEDAIDIPTIYKVLDVCGGIKLNDPNLLAAAAEALGKN